MPSSIEIEEYRRVARLAGMSEVKIEEEIAEIRRQNAALDRGVCPWCRTRIGRNVDSRQSGPSLLAGTWVNYRCTCGYMVDRKESLPGTSS